MMFLNGLLVCNALKRCCIIVTLVSGCCHALTVCFYRRGCLYIVSRLTHLFYYEKEASAWLEKHFFSAIVLALMCHSRADQHAHT